MWWNRLAAVLILLTCTCALGCSGAGKPGDANDPAQSTDTEAMSKETGDVGNANSK